jgi:hypothetical protein
MSTQNLDHTEAALEAVEEGIEHVIETVTVVRNNPFLIAGVALVAASAGAAGGYYWAKKRLTTKFDAIMENEIHEAKEFYAAQYKAEEYETPEKAVEKLIPKEERKKSKSEKEAANALVNYQGHSVLAEQSVTEIELTPTEQGVDAEIITSNIFVNGQPLDEGDYDETDEEALKSMGKPYVITEDSFGENEDGYEQIQVTWYAKDQILADDRDQVIDDADGLVGEINMTKFGQGSGDKHIVFIRNDEKELEIEVARSKGSYAEEVAGFRHSDEDDRHTIRRFRGDDE